MQLTSWVLTGFFLGSASLQVAGGKLSDHFGLRRMLMIGISIFLITSITGAISTSIWQLIVSRIIQGCSVGLFWPPVLVIALDAFEDREKNFVMGVMIGAAGLAMTIGPPLGGFLIAISSWRWILGVNVPICFLILSFSILFIPKDQPLPQKRSIPELYFF